MKEYIERESLTKIFTTNEKVGKVSLSFVRAVIKNAAPAVDAIEADRLGRVGRLMLPNKGCPRGPIGRLGMADGKTQDKKAILVEELCCMDTFEDVDGNVWRPVQEEVLQEVIEILRKEE